MQPSSSMASGTRYQMASGKSETAVERVQIEIENKKYAKFKKEKILYIATKFLCLHKAYFAKLQWKHLCRYIQTHDVHKESHDTA